MSQNTSTSSLTETTLDSEVLVRGGFLEVRRDHVRLPDGATTTREYIVHPGAVVVIPLLDDGRLVMERQYRYPVRQAMIEFPAGKLDPGEDLQVCGERELREETGYSAMQWAYAGQIHIAIGYSDEVLHVYLARGLRAGERKLDEGEFLDVFTMSRDELARACLDGSITDAKTLSCALRLRAMDEGEWQPDWQPARLG
ncbi:NUDIX hydrolase [Verticiella sediminum]|uniref:GDP-mannose pyrophosphatase n=1 Tax=Verticiella sediminum TaxID=1247510 RepID=A0A556AYL1_9BURK|nr:NUDIX hydrolase [Verticiella sediminum]TSH98023.1 NUDIX hydrolase [Verticiella sediminum]